MTTIKGGVVLADPFNRRSMEMMPKNLQMVAVADPRNGPWTGNNNLGIEQKFRPSANDRQTIIKLPEWGFPEVWTISLGIKAFPGGSYDFFGIDALIEYGVGGCTQTMKADWINGTQLTVAMNALNIIAEFSDLDLLTEGQGLSLSVQLARGQRASSTAPVYTLRDAAGVRMETFLVTAGNATPQIPIPPFVNKVYAVPAMANGPLIGTFYGADTLFGVESGNGFGFRIVSGKRGSDLLADPGIAVTGDGRFCRFRNNSASPLEVTIYGELAA